VEKGAGAGGGLAMNDGVATCLNVLRSVFQFLDAKGQKLVHLDDEDLFIVLKPYGQALGKYLASLSNTERKNFRELRAAQGLIVRMRRCQAGMRQFKPEFNPDGLNDSSSWTRLRPMSKRSSLLMRWKRPSKRP